MQSNNILTGSDLRYQIISNIRKETGISYNLAVLSFEIVLDNLLESFPHIRPSLINLDNKNKDNEISPPLIGDRDGDRLTELLSSIVTAKDDSQQRSWSLHADESIILSQVEEIHNLLNDGNPLAVKMIIKSNEYEYLHNLILFYQMEPRASIRLFLLKCFAVVCTWGSAFISELITSVLFLEIVRELLTINDEVFISLSISILTSIFLSGESIPISYYKDLNSHFINFVLDWIESERNYSELFIKLILAFNLQFPQLSTNLVMKELANRKSDKILTQSILIYLNREEDPIKEFSCEEIPLTRNSVIKFICDIFSSFRTGNYFYTNDLHVLIDILIRQLNDLYAYDKKIIDYLNIVQLIMENSDYLEEEYRMMDLKKVLQRIQLEEDTSPEKIIVDKIFAYINV